MYYKLVPVPTWYIIKSPVKSSTSTFDHKRGDWIEWRAPNPLYYFVNDRFYHAGVDTIKAEHYNYTGKSLGMHTDPLSAFTNSKSCSIVPTPTWPMPQIQPKSGLKASGNVGVFGSTFPDGNSITIKNCSTVEYREANKPILNAPMSKEEEKTLNKIRDDQLRKMFGQ